MAFGHSEPFERADVAAAEDGRTPLNTCSDAGEPRSDALGQFPSREGIWAG